MIKNQSELEFAIFCIEGLGERLNSDGRRIYRALTVESNILDDYIIPEYEILHTQDKEYILDDIMQVMKERGVRI